MQRTASAVSGRTIRITPAEAGLLIDLIEESLKFQELNMAVVAGDDATDLVTLAWTLIGVRVAGGIIVGRIGRFPHHVSVCLHLRQLMRLLPERRGPPVSQNRALHHVGGQPIATGGPTRRVGGIRRALVDFPVLGDKVEKQSAQVRRVRIGGR